MATDISGVSTRFFSTAYGGFTDSLASSASAGAATVALNSAAEYATGDVVVLVVNPGDAVLEAFFTGSVNGNSIENVVWVGGPGIAAAHSAGAPVRDYVSAAGHAMMTKGLLQQHKQDGSHEAITADSLVTTGAVTVGTDLTVDDDLVVTGDTNMVGTISENGVLLSSIRAAQGQQSFIESGLNPSTATGLTVNVPAGVYWIAGKRYTYAGGTKAVADATTNHLDINTAGSITAVASGGALTANSVRFATITAAAGAVTTYTLTGWDASGTRTHNLDPRTMTIMVAQDTGDRTTTSTTDGTATAVAALSVPFTAVANQQYRVRVTGNSTNSGANTNSLQIWDGTVGSGTKKAEAVQFVTTATGRMPIAAEWVGTLSAGAHTINVGLKTSAGTFTLAGTVTPSVLTVEKV